MVEHDRRPEDRRVEVRVGDGLLGDPLRPEEPGALDRGGIESAEEDEPLHPVALGRLEQPDCGESVQLLDTVRRLVADRGGEMDHGVNAAHCLSQHVGIREFPQVAHRDLDVDPVGAEPSRFTNQAPDLMSVLEQAGQQP